MLTIAPAKTIMTFIIYNAFVCIIRICERQFLKEPKNATEQECMLTVHRISAPKWPEWDHQCLLLFRSKSLTSDIKSSPALLSRFSELGVLLCHMAVTKRWKYLFCKPLCNMKRKCIVIRSSNENDLTISTFPNRVEHDWLILILQCWYII